MSEGGMYPWRCQNLNIAPTLNVPKLVHAKPLVAPKGQRWKYDPSNKEWSLVSSDEAANSTIVCVAKEVAVRPATTTAAATATATATTTVVDDDDEDEDKQLVVVSRTTDGTEASSSLDDDDDDDDNNNNINNPFIEHRIKPTDTFQGICIKYKIQALELRRANGGFTGMNLNLLPTPLLIPKNARNTTSTTSLDNKTMKNNKKNNTKNIDSSTITTIVVEEEDTSAATTESSSSLSSSPSLSSQEYKQLTENDVIDILLRECPGTTRHEGRKQLQLSEWNFPLAVESTKITLLLKLLRNYYPPPPHRRGRPILLHRNEAKAYLLFNDWNVPEAFKDAIDDDADSENRE